MVAITAVSFNSGFRALWLNVNKKVQFDATICRHLFTAKSLYMFRASQHLSSGALKTVTATSGIGHNTGTATSFQRGLLKKKKKTKVPLYHTNVNSKIHLIVRIIFFIRSYRKSVKLFIYFFFFTLSGNKTDRLSGLVERPKLRVIKMEEIVSGNSFVGRRRASHLHKKFLCYHITSHFPNGREHSIHLFAAQAVWFQFMCVHLNSWAPVMHRVSGRNWLACTSLTLLQ